MGEKVQFGTEQVLKVISCSLAIRASVGTNSNLTKTETETFRVSSSMKRRFFCFNKKVSRVDCSQSINRIGPGHWFFAQFEDKDSSVWGNKLYPTLFFQFLDCLAELPLFLY